MIARVADHCLWLGRYLERSESVARHLRVTSALSLDAELPTARVWHPVVIVAGQEEDFLARFGAEAVGDAERVQRYLALDADNPVSLARSVALARDNARSIREVVSLEVWEVVNELHVSFASGDAEASFMRDRDAFYRAVQSATQLSLGLLRSTMLHDTPLDFIWLGVMLERLGQTARLLDVQHHALVAEGAPHPVLETALWLSLLRACSGFEPFMKRSQGRVTGPRVAAFLVLEARFPRSVRYCASAARERLARIHGDGELAASDALDLLTALEGQLDDNAADSLEGPRVHEVLTAIVDVVHRVCDAIDGELHGTRAAVSAPSQFQSQ